MRKLLYTAVLVLTLNACTEEKDSGIDNPNKVEEPKTEEPKAEESTEQKETRLEINAEVDASGNLVGVVSKEQLEKDAKFKTTFNNNYNNYSPDTGITTDLKTALEGIKIVGYLGTWCPDSKREVPKFYKIMDAINFTNFDMIAVNTSKKANGLENDYNLKFVATFVLIKDNAEIGRFVESINGTNSSSLENDLLIIAKGENYTPGRQ